MKEYHTDIIIKAPVASVWQALINVSSYPEWNPLVGWLKGDIITGGQIEMFIKPLDQSFEAKLTQVEENQSLRWVGVQFAPWILSGEHYYQLSSMDSGTTLLQHGEYFRGLGSLFIRKTILQKMEASFIQHNQLLKERIENG